MKGNKLQMIIILVLFSTFILTVAAGIIHDGYENIQIWDTDYIEWEDGWYYIEDSAEIQVSLPATVYSKNGWASIYAVIPQNIAPGYYVRIWTQYQKLYVYVDDEEVFSFEALNFPTHMKGYGKYSFLIPIPEQSIGQCLELRTYTNDSEFAGVYSEVVAGTMSGILFSMWGNYGLILCIGLLMFVYGLIFIVIYCIFRRIANMDRSLLLLAVEAILIACQFFGESRFIQVVSENPVLNMGMAYGSYLLMPIVLIQLIYELCFNKDRIWMKIIFYADMVFTIALFFMVYFGIVPLSNLTLYNAYALIVISIYFVFLFIDEIRKGNQYIRRCTYSLLITVASVAAKFVLDMFGYSFADCVLYIGVFLSMMVFAYILLHKTYEVTKTANEAGYYEKLAYTDLLTKCKSRTAFQIDIEKYEKYPGKIKSLCIVVLDVNNLKGINDFQGHTKGDNALCMFSECIRSSFEGTGSVYRYGGDEFICILQGQSADVVNERIKRLKASIADIKDDILQCGLSYGVAFYEAGRDKTFRDILTRADTLMYECKREMKERRQVINITRE